MLNRLSDRILSLVLPHQTAAAICGDYYLKACTLCAGGRIYYKRCQDCTSGSHCGTCSIWRAC